MELNRQEGEYSAVGDSVPYCRNAGGLGDGGLGWSWVPASRMSMRYIPKDLGPVGSGD